LRNLAPSLVPHGTRSAGSPSTKKRDRPIFGQFFLPAAAEKVHTSTKMAAPGEKINDTQTEIVPTKERIVYTAAKMIAAAAEIVHTRKKIIHA
jgi:hypothetical protein